MTRPQWWIVIALALPFALPAKAKAVPVANDFTAVFRNVSNENAFDFEMSVSGRVRQGNAKLNPISNVFTNFTVSRLTNTADGIMFTGGNVPAGQSHTVVYRALYDPQDPLRPTTGLTITSIFTRQNGTNIGSSSMRLALDASATFQGTSLAFLSLIDDSGFPLNGTVAVFANPGLDFFDTDQYDVLRPGAVTILPSEPFSLADGGVLPTVLASLAPDQYLLVRGTVSDPSGPVSFSMAFTPAEGPSTLLLLVSGVIGLALRMRRTGRKVRS